MDVDQVPGFVRDWLHPDPTDALLLRSLLMVCSGNMVQQTFRLVEADPAKEAVISALSRKKPFTHMKVIISVFMFLVVFLVLEHEVTQLANILTVGLPVPLQEFQPGGINDNLPNKIL